MIFPLTLILAPAICAASTIKKTPLPRVNPAKNSPTFEKVLDEILSKIENTKEEYFGPATSQSGKGHQPTDNKINELVSQLLEVLTLSEEGFTFNPHRAPSNKELQLMTKSLKEIKQAGFEVFSGKITRGFPNGVFKHTLQNNWLKNVPQQDRDAWKKHLAFYYIISNWDDRKSNQGEDIKAYLGDILSKDEIDAFVQRWNQALLTP